LGKSNYFNRSGSWTGILARKISELPQDDPNFKFIFNILKQILVRRNEFLRNNNISYPLDMADRLRTFSYLEKAILLSICSTDSEVVALAIGSLKEACDEMYLSDSEEIVPNVKIYKDFIDEIVTSNISFSAGKVAQQKHIRKMLRSLSHFSESIQKAWEEGYRRWTILTSIVTKNPDEILEPADTKKKLNVFGNSKQLVRSITVEAKEEKDEFQNYTAFLCSLGGCYQLVSEKSSIELNVINSINQFMKELLEMLTCDFPVIRESVKEILGAELSPALYYYLFNHLSSKIDFILSGLNESNFSEKANLHVDQAISVFRLILERMSSSADKSFDFGKLVLSYVNFLEKLGRSIYALKAKVKMCQLIDIFMAKREFLSLRDEIKLRHKLLESFVEWSSGISV
jgi:hypothetical protein